MTRAGTERGLGYLRRRIEFAGRRVDGEDALALMMGTTFTLGRRAYQNLRFIARFETYFFHGYSPKICSMPGASESLTAFPQLSKTNAISIEKPGAK